MQNPIDDTKALDRVVAGALKNAIKDHGPITNFWLTSATKRIVSALCGHLKVVTAHHLIEYTNSQLLRENAELRAKLKRHQKVTRDLVAKCKAAGLIVDGNRE